MVMLGGTLRVLDGSMVLVEGGLASMVTSMVTERPATTVTMVPLKSEIVGGSVVSVNMGGGLKFRAARGVLETGGLKIRRGAVKARWVKN